MCNIFGHWLCFVEVPWAARKMGQRSGKLALVLPLQWLGWLWTSLFTLLGFHQWLEYQSQLCHTLEDLDQLTASGIRGSKRICFQGAPPWHFVTPTGNEHRCLWEHPGSSNEEDVRNWADWSQILSSSWSCHKIFHFQCFHLLATNLNCYETLYWPMTVGQKWPTRAMGDIYSLLTQGSSVPAADLGLEGRAASPTGRTDTLSWPRLGWLVRASQPCCSDPSLSSPSAPEGYRSAGAHFPLPTGGPACGGREKRVSSRQEPDPVGAPPPESCHIWDTSWRSSHTWDARGCRLQTAPPAGAGAGCRGACDIARNPRARHFLPAGGQRGLRKLTRIHSSGGNWALEQQWKPIPVWD